MGYYKIQPTQFWQVFWRMDATKKSDLDRVGLVRREACLIGFGSGSREIFN